MNDESPVPCWPPEDLDGLAKQVKQNRVTRRQYKRGKRSTNDRWVKQRSPWVSNHLFCFDERIGRSHIAAANGHHHVAVPVRGATRGRATQVEKVNRRALPLFEEIMALDDGFPPVRIAIDQDSAAFLECDGCGEKKESTWELQRMLRSGGMLLGVRPLVLCLACLPCFEQDQDPVDIRELHKRVTR